MVNNFLVSREIDSRLNITNICMIPKMERHTKITEMRPISLCNVGYKIISNVLCQRLEICIPSLVSEIQSALVAGRLIYDNILIAQEMFHGLRTNKACQGKYMTVKTDMSKMYNRVEWDFIKVLLQKMGFHYHWIKLMMECISSVQYRVLLNGQPQGLIVLHRVFVKEINYLPIYLLCVLRFWLQILRRRREEDN